jgi:hypothetical protein
MTSVVDIPLRAAIKDERNCLESAPHPTRGGSMGEGDTTLRDEDIRTEASWESRSEVADMDDDDTDSTDADTDDTDSDADDTDA